MIATAMLLVRHGKSCLYLHANIRANRRQRDVNHCVQKWVQWMGPCILFHTIPQVLGCEAPGSAAQPAQTGACTLRMLRYTSDECSSNLENSPIAAKIIIRIRQPRMQTHLSRFTCWLLCPVWPGTFTCIIHLRCIYMYGTALGRLLMDT